VHNCIVYTTGVAGIWGPQPNITSVLRMGVPISLSEIWTPKSIELNFSRILDGFSVWRAMQGSVLHSFLYLHSDGRIKRVHNCIRYPYCANIVCFKKENCQFSPSPSIRKEDRELYQLQCLYCPFKLECHQASLRRKCHRSAINHLLRPSPQAKLHPSQ
jgi:hypothetical protein